MTSRLLLPISFRMILWLKKELSESKRGAGMISSALDIAGDDQTPTIGPVATHSLERSGTMTSVSARQRVPLPDANHTDQNWDLGRGRILSEDTVYGAVVACGCHGKESRTDLDSHANMPVVGSGVHVLVDHNRTCEVNPYTPDYQPMEVPLVDAAVRYDRDGRKYILLIQNALYVPSKKYNLVPP
jgi:hypothetical protein